MPSATGHPTWVTITGVSMPIIPVDSPYQIVQTLSYNAYAEATNTPPTAGTANVVSLIPSGSGAALYLGTLSIVPGSSASDNIYLQDTNSNTFFSILANNSSPPIYANLDGLKIGGGMGVNLVASQNCSAVLTYRIGKDISFRS